MAIPGLLPCPFCGNKRVTLRSMPLQIAFLVECPACRARGPERHVTNNDRMSRDGMQEDAKRRAAEGWNNSLRTPDMIREWMDQEACTQCGRFYPKGDLYRVDSEVLCRDCYAEMKELEEMLK